MPTVGGVGGGGGWGKRERENIEPSLLNCEGEIYCWSSITQYIDMLFLSKRELGNSVTQKMTEKTMRFKTQSRICF